MVCRTCILGRLRRGGPVEMRLSDVQLVIFACVANMRVRL